jgi:hypothetical protein
MLPFPKGNENVCAPFAASALHIPPHPQRRVISTPKSSPSPFHSALSERLRRKLFKSRSPEASTKVKTPLPESDLRYRH